MGSSQIPLRFWIRPGWVASRVLRLSFASVNRVGNCQFRQFASKLVLGNEMARFDSGARFGEEVVVVGEGRGVAELTEEERDLSAMIGGVVEGVMDELVERVGGAVEGARRVQLGLCDVAQIAHIGFVVHGPCPL